MATYRLRFHTGPLRGRDGIDFARKLRRAKLRVVDVGTETVTIDMRASRMNGCAGAEHNVRAAYFRKYRRTLWSRLSACAIRPTR